MIYAYYDFCIIVPAIPAGSIELGMPGSLIVKAGKHRFTGPAYRSPELNTWSLDLFEHMPRIPLNPADLPLSE
jgi:uncharacterized protein (DUF2345 family)